MKNLTIITLSMALLLLSVSVSAQTTGAIISEGYYLLPSPSLLNDLVKVVAADGITFGMDPDGKVIAWGEDALGLVDIIDPTETYLDVSAGFLHVLLLHENGSIDAYSGPDTWFPLAPPEPNSGYTAVSAGTFFSMALRQDGSVETWGSSLPSVPEPNSEFSAIAAGSGTAYALRKNGSIAVWGSNTHGQHDVPEPNRGFVALSAGDHFALALRDDGSIAVWGRDNHGQQSLPDPNSGFKLISAGPYHALALREDASIETWGEYNFGLADLPEDNSDFAQISAGFDHNVGLRTDGQVVAWGNRDHRSCGVYPANENYVAVENNLAIRDDGSLWLYLQGYAPPNVPDPNIDFVQVQPRATWNLALRGGGSIATWGDNYSGQLNVPVPNSGFASISSGTLHSVALRTNGTIEAWGENWSGQCNIPEPAAEYLAVTAGSQHSAAIKRDGSISVWGYTTLGPSPTETGYVAVAAGRYSTMALHEDGHIDVWSEWAPALAVPEPNSGFIAIQSQEKTCVAMREDGTLVAWGSYIWNSNPLFAGNSSIAAFSSGSSSVFAIEAQPVSAVGAEVPTPVRDIVLGAHPNPFNPSVTVWFTASRNEQATIAVFDLKGRQIRDLWSGPLTTGQRRTAVWDGYDDSGLRVASGTYVVKLQGQHGGLAVKKIALVK